MVALLLVGFTVAIMSTLGIAMLLLGEVPFLNGKRIPAKRSRLIGLVLLSFGPLAFGIRQLLNVLMEDYVIDGQAVTWSVFGGCCIVILTLLFRVVVPKHERRRPTHGKTQGKESSFGEANRIVETNDSETPALPWMEPASEPPQVKKSAAPAVSPATPRKAPTKPPQKSKPEPRNPFDFG